MKLNVQPSARKYNFRYSKPWRAISGTESRLLATAPELRPSIHPAWPVKVGRNRFTTSILRIAMFRFDSDSIKQAYPIEQYLRERGVELYPYQKGILMARCPLPDHDDRTPSFAVYTEQGQFYCFGCQAHGDVIALVMELEQLDFPGACKRLGGILENVSWTGRGRSSRSEVESRSDKLKKAAQRGRDKILSGFRWIEQEILRSSPICVDASTADWRTFIGALYRPESTLWMGELTQSGSERFRDRFRTVSEWTKQPEFPGSHICPATFKSGSHSRSAINVVETPYLVIEGDFTLGKKPETDEEKAENRRNCAAITRWMVQILGLRLVAIVDTGNKSLHSWFARPSPEMVEELKAIAPVLGVDTALFTPSHPCRLPGAIHSETGNAARLLYLNPLYNS